MKSTVETEIKDYSITSTPSHQLLHCHQFILFMYMCGSIAPALITVN